MHTVEPRVNEYTHTHPIKQAHINKLTFVHTLKCCAHTIKDRWSGWRVNWHFWLSLSQPLGCIFRHSEYSHLVISHSCVSACAFQLRCDYLHAKYCDVYVTNRRWTGWEGDEMILKGETTDLVGKKVKQETAHISNPINLYSVQSRGMYNIYTSSAIKVVLMKTRCHM